MSLASSITGTLTKLLAQFGTPITLTQVSDSGYDPATGTQSVNTTIYVCNAVTDFEKYQADEGEMIDGRSVMQPPAAGVVPAPGDRLTFNGVEYVVVRCDPASLEGVMLAFEVFFRRIR